MGLKVLMMGGRRCGKTSALASIFDQMQNGATNEFLTVSDQTPLPEGYEWRNSLVEKRLELENFIARGGNKTFLVKGEPTMNFWDYTLQLQIPGTNKRMDILFRDSAGEYFDAGGRHHNEVVDFIQDCDVFVVVVDTPYLMEGTDVEAKAANVIDSIHTFLTQIDGRKAKQVLFVPLKCEKWVKEGRIDEVVAAVEDKYAATIRDLSASDNTEISIIPIETAGGIIFAGLKRPYILFNSSIRCAKINDRLALLRDGTFHNISDDEIIADDPEAFFKFDEQPAIVLPNAWFRLLPHAEYSPHNCEQVLLHIARFMFNKKKAEAKGGLIGAFISSFGGISAADMQNVLDNLSRTNLIKDSGEGIKRIKRCFP